MNAKSLKKPRGCSRAHVYRLAKLALQEGSGSNCQKLTATAVRKAQANTPILKHCLDGRSAVSILQSPNSAVTPVMITGNHSMVHDAVNNVIGTNKEKRIVAHTGKIDSPFNACVCRGIIL
ncbi:hypothetical protein EG68_10185 [Paragonimus skrjabini miyazakii]|uniref:Uncharacterized protein n=1 Tax=Paragonimus skrjabini miyazakii TaxID=59628 RepID=A0A8S9YG28_9TREM|nr:hypothetical protein EG68_10185 [Paragonimus skrjabini miyazakii]